MVWTREHRIIRIELFDAETRIAIGGARVRAEQLPASFTPDTTMEIGGITYAVIQAHPPTAEEFHRTGRLQLLMRRLAAGSSDPSRGLSSVPSVCGTLPELAGPANGGRRFLDLGNNDWRQVEFLPLSLQKQIDAQFADIWRIFDDHREGPGFNRVHVRADPVAPLEAARLTIADLRGLLHDTTPFDGLAIDGKLAKDTFAAQLPCGLQIYGAHRDGILHVLALHRVGEGGVPDIPAIAAFAQSHRLCLIDWCRVLQLRPGDDDFREYLSSGL